MRTEMTLEMLLENVIEQKQQKRDLTTSTQDNIRMVANTDGPGVSLVILRDGADELERFEVMEHAHRQIATRLGIPTRYYFRLLEDHRDLVLVQVNALFEREPESRLVRILGNSVRAFLSDRYARMDNYELLSDTLPSIVSGEHETRLMSSNVDAHKMNMKVIFTGDELAHEIAQVRGEPRIIRPGFRLSNSETGQGSLKMEGFFYDSYCTNGCVFGFESAFNMKHTHLGGRLIEGADFEVISNGTQEKRRELVKSEVNDALEILSNPDKVEAMANTLREKANSEKCVEPVAAVDALVKELPISEVERDGVLETFLRDGDYSQFGLSSAVTEQANKDVVDYNRACELETIGGQILQLTARKWSAIANSQKVAIAA